MKYLNLILIALLSMLRCELFDTFDEEWYAENAEEFALQVIDTYCTRDIDTFESFLPYKIYWCEADEKPVGISKFDVEKHFSYLSNDTITIEDYKNHYNYYILTYDDYNNKQWIIDIHYWEPDDQDFLFIGNNLKEEQYSELILDDLLIFFVRYENSRWKIKAFWG